MAWVVASSIGIPYAPDFYYRENDREESQRLKRRAHRFLCDAEGDAKDQRECREDKSGRAAPHFGPSSWPSVAWRIRACQDRRDRLDGSAA